MIQNWHRSADYYKRDNEIAEKITDYDSKYNK